MTDTSDYLDTIFETLRSPDRRHVLTYLQEDPDHYTTVDVLADRLTAEAYDTDDTDYEQAKEQTLVNLRHTHIPKLAESHLVAYDERTGDVTDATHEDDSRDALLHEYLGAFDAEDTYLDDVFDMLSHEKRRQTLYFLEKDQDRRSTLPGIADHLADDPDERQNMALQLAHTHLPKLEDSGWVAYDPDTQKVQLTVDPDTEPDGILLHYLEQTYEQEL